MRISFIFKRRYEDVIQSWRRQLMKKTGVFYHPSFSERGYPVLKDRVKPAYERLKQSRVLNSKGIVFLESKMIPEELILRVHTKAMLEQVKQSGYYEVANLSAGGAVAASEMVWRGDLDNAFVFTGTAGHHAGPSSFWGFCYLNDVAIAIANLREKFNGKKFAILDTDSHHGDGTRAIFESDLDVLHVCFCSGHEVSGYNTKICVTTPHQISDEEYLALVENNFPGRVKEFKPEIIFWHFGYDTHRNDYGARGLSVKCFPEIARIAKKTAEEICCGKLVVVLCGGSNPEVAAESIPKIVRLLAEIK
jgi:acetoin utilization deacetylase AcuC-like enzyme